LHLRRRGAEPPCSDLVGDDGVLSLAIEPRQLRHTRGDSMDQRLSLITLGVRDVSRAQAFYQALG
jgi:hypothetical protein